MVHELFSVDIMVISLICNQQDCTRGLEQAGGMAGEGRESSQTEFLRVSLCYVRLQRGCLISYVLTKSNVGSLDALGLGENANFTRPETSFE